MSSPARQRFSPLPFSFFPLPRRFHMVESSPARRRRQLGELLLKEHLVTPDQLNRALEIHRATGERLGRGVLGKGVGDTETHPRLLTPQNGTEVMHPNRPAPPGE